MSSEQGIDERLVRVVLPQHLRALAGTGAEVTLEVAAPVTMRRVLDALEARYPALGGTIREHGTGQRRAYMRIFACERIGRMNRWIRSCRKQSRMEKSRC